MYIKAIEYSSSPSLQSTRSKKKIKAELKAIRSCLPAFSEAGADVSLLQAVDGEVPDFFSLVHWLSCGLFR